MDALAPIFDMLASIAEVVLPAINLILSPLIEGFSLIGDIVSLYPVELLALQDGYLKDQ
jgi:hypothetical protein